MIVDHQDPAALRHRSLLPSGSPPRCAVTQHDDGAGPRNAHVHAIYRGSPALKPVRLRSAACVCTASGLERVQADTQRTAFDTGIDLLGETERGLEEAAGGLVA